ncbi:hypothetical protein DFA_03308 [Cavenderia fasciculata]|uniref:Uncharacterized protein n=1 Tax=Cavenderia fasciculata TaxID=261658 RepID=F4PH78_CACFS|nr:uncharacterized protein DFA_03308 [Cavenderia fasciculata]EGG25062.1 hypothetical protein DFA_03308 [Cavenderia fasciculata]|eukprot:XP_004362913.1 hypothetical protein DFA_03308 [Cavenderia fasciculata]
MKKIVASFILFFFIVNTVVVNATFNLEGVAYVDSLFNGQFDGQAPILENTLIDYGEKVSIYIELVTDASVNFEQRTNSSSAFNFEQIDDGCYTLTVIPPADDLRWEFLPVFSHYTVCGSGSGGSSNIEPASRSTTSSSPSSSSSSSSDNTLSSSQSSQDGSVESTVSDTIVSETTDTTTTLTPTTQSVAETTAVGTSTITTIRQDVGFSINSFMGCVGNITNDKTGQSMNLQFGTYNLRYYGWCVNTNNNTNNNNNNANCINSTKIVFPEDCQLVAQSMYQVTVQYRGQIKVSFNRNMAFSVTGSDPNTTPIANINVTLSYIYNGVITHSTMTTTTLDNPTFSVPLVEVSVAVTTDNITQIVLLNNITNTPTIGQPNFDIVFSLYELPPIKDRHYIPVTLFSQSNRMGLSITLPPGIYNKAFLASLGFSNLSVLSFSSTYKYRVFLSVSTSPSSTISDIPLNGYFVESYNTGTIVQIQITGNYEFSNNPLPIFGGYVKVLNVYHPIFKPSYFLAETPFVKTETYLALNCTDAPYMGYHNCTVPSRVGPRYIKTQLNNEKFLSYAELVYYPDYYSARSMDSRIFKPQTSGRLNLSAIVDLSYSWKSSFTPGLEGTTRINTYNGGFNITVAGKTIAVYNYTNLDAINFLAFETDGRLSYYNGSVRLAVISGKIEVGVVDSLLMNREGITIMAFNEATWGIYAFPDQYWRYKRIHPAAFIMSSRYLDALDDKRNNERGRLVWAINSTEKTDYNNVPMDYGSYLFRTDSILSTDTRNFITNGKQYVEVRADGNLIIYENNIYVDHEVLALTEIEVSEDAPYALNVHDNGVSLTSASYPDEPYFNIPAVPGSAPIQAFYMYPQAGDANNPYYANRLSWGVLMVDANGKVSGGLLGAQDNRPNYTNTVTTSSTIDRLSLSPTTNLTNQFLNLRWNNQTGVIDVVQVDINQVVWSSPEPPVDTPTSLSGEFHAGFICIDPTDPLQILQFCVATCTQLSASDACQAYSPVWQPLQSGSTTTPPEQQQWFGLVIGFPELVLVNTQGRMTWSARIANIILRDY